MAASLDLSGIAELRRRFENIDRTEFRTELSQVLSATALAEVSNGFRLSRDPYGRPWRPLAWRKGQPLLKTGRMRASTNSGRIGPDGFSIRIGANYAIYHQDGSGVRRPRAGQRSRARVGKLPQRMMVPDARSGIGQIWGASFWRDASALLRRRLARGD
jgi:phage gpG-like protein